MAGVPMASAEERRRRDAVLADPGASLVVIADRLGLKPSTLRGWIAQNARDLLGQRRTGRPRRIDLTLTELADDEDRPTTSTPVHVSASGCRVVVWREWPPGTSVVRRVWLTEGDNNDGATWSVDCVTCRRAWIATSEDHAHQLRDLHLADRTAPSATTRREAS